MGPGGNVEASRGIDKGIEKQGDPSNLNEQEGAVVDFFAESYNPGMPAGGGGGGSDPKTEEEKKKAKLKLENKFRFVKSSVLQQAA